jgi:hypothetical protein
MGGMGMMNGMMGDDQQDMDIFQIDASSALKSTSNLPKIGKNRICWRKIVIFHLIDACE